MDYDYKPNLNIEAWPREAAMATEFRKRGYTVILPPVSLPNEHADISSFKEDCDFVAIKGQVKWKVMHKSQQTLNPIDPADPINSLQQLDLSKDKEKAWGEKGNRRIPTDPTWKNKFQQFCREEEIQDWYSERLWAVSDQDVRITFFFKGKDIIDTNLRGLYFDSVWNVMPITDQTKYWPSDFIPRLDDPWPAVHLNF
jgi:hypothetical protein